MSAPAGQVRLPPHDLDAEQCVLGGMMLSRDAIADVTVTLAPGDYYRPAHQVVHEAIIHLYGRGEPADAVTVADYLSRRGELPRVGGHDYLHTLIAAVPVAANAGYYARIVRDQAVLRRCTEQGMRIVQLGYSADAADAAAVGERALDLAAQIPVPAGGDTMTDAASLLYETLGDVEQGTGDGIPWPFTDLTALTHGMYGGQMIIIGARPAVGKSTAGLNTAAAAAIRYKVPTVIFSLEMGARELMLRLISAEARVPFHLLMARDPKVLTEEHWTRIAAAQERIQAAPLRIDDNPGVSPGYMRSAITRLDRERGWETGLVIVDYVQLMREPPRAETRQAAVSANSREIKTLAKELDIPIVVLAQLSRKTETRSDKVPELQDLRESGSLENDADIVILLHREDAYGRESPRAGECDLIVAKHRNGPTATVTVAFQGHFARFVDMAPGSPEDDNWSPSGVLRRKNHLRRVK